MMNGSTCVSLPSEPDHLLEVRQVTYLIVLPIEVCVGLLLNILGLIAFKKTSLKTSCHLYLNSLAFANISVLILAIPVLIYSADSPVCGGWSDAIYETYIAQPLLNAAITFSVIVSLLMSIQRYVSVCRPASFRRIYKPKTMQSSLAISFVVSVVIQIPRMFHRRMDTCRTSDSAPGSCNQWISRPDMQVMDSIEWKAYLWTSEALIRWIPCLLLIILNLITIVRYRGVIEKRKQMTSRAVSTSSVNVSSMRVSVTTPLSPSHSDEKRLLILMIAMLVVFVCCLIPAGLVTLFYQPSSVDDYDYRIFFSTAHCLQLLYFSIIHLLCCLSNHDIRKQLWFMMTCNG